MKRIAIILMSVVLFLPFQGLTVKAETSLNADYLQYDSFQKKYNEHLAELLYYTGVSYDSNDHYFKENIDLYRNAVDSTFDKGLLNDTLNTFLDGTEYFQKPVSLLLSANDFRERLFGKIKDFFTSQDLSDHKVNNQSSHSVVRLYPPSGYYYMDNLSPNFRYAYIQLEQYAIDNKYTSVALFLADGSSAHAGAIQGLDISIKTAINNQTLNNSGVIMSIYKQVFPDRHLILVKIDDGTSHPLGTMVVPPQITNIYNRIVESFDPEGKIDPNYSPDVTPQLICPDDQNFDLQYSDGSFYTKQRTQLVVNPDETVNFNGSICNLDFKFPSLEFDELTGDVVADGQSIKQELVLPSDDYDYSILEYISNSYQYATSVINTGVNGLKSIINGTSGLVAFTGSMFAFLPPEILTLFIGGFTVALGLWVFKR